ncbi:hypothetical protein GH733_011982 [Mirounga leonina]|nr:hypothetical protein GH733_011982 [Mirounga leonina]
MRVQGITSITMTGRTWTHSCRASCPVRNRAQTQTGLRNFCHSIGEHNHLQRLLETVNKGGQTHSTFRYAPLKSEEGKKRQMVVEPESDNKQECGDASAQKSLDVARKVVTEDGTMISIEPMLSVSRGRKEEDGSDEASSPPTEPSPYTNAMLTKKCELLYCLGEHVGNKGLPVYPE